jgi:transcriptional regulator with XRE-family HTH domain
MAVGDRIKRARILRNLTQKQLGLEVGFEENTADVRIAQYESGTRNPKGEMLGKLAWALDVNVDYLYEPTDYYTFHNVMFALFELDELYGLDLHDIDGSVCIAFEDPTYSDQLSEWLEIKKFLTDGDISKEEYLEWKLSWPFTTSTGDGAGILKPWRKNKPPETTD